MKKLLFIYNIHAGMGQLRPFLPDVLDIFTKNGFLVTAYPTQGPKDAVGLVSKHAKSHAYVVCAGGDGTFNEVLDAIMLMEKKPHLAYIPCGSTNDFACNLGIPAFVTNAAELVSAGRPRAIDVGGFTGGGKGKEEFFSYIAAFGLFTDVAYKTPQSMKNAVGHMAYILEGVKRLGNIKTFHCKLTLEGETIEDDFIFGMVTNSSVVGGFSLLPSQTDENDKRPFTLIMLRRLTSLYDIGTVISTLIEAEPPNEELFIIKTINSASFAFDGEAQWTLDGEYGGAHRNVCINIRQKAVELILP